MKTFAIAASILFAMSVFSMTLFTQTFFMKHTNCTGNEATGINCSHAMTWRTLSQNQPFADWRCWYTFRSNSCWPT